MENWNSIFISAMRSSANKVFTVIYFVSWIFIGNFILLNLFLAILLDSFLEEKEEEDKEIEEEEKNKEEIEQKRQKLKKSKRNNSKAKSFLKVAKIDKKPKSIRELVQ
jgi:regulatory protein YycI of two-component signal transduction system YycFG